MRVLLDTHAYVWWETDDPKLPARARAVIADGSTTVLVSAVTAWELANKVRFGKWPEAAVLAQDIEAALREESFEALPITPGARSPRRLPARLPPRSVRSYARGAGAGRGRAADHR